MDRWIVYKKINFNYINGKSLDYWCSRCSLRLLHERDKLSLMSYWKKRGSLLSFINILNSIEDMEED